MICNFRLPYNCKRITSCINVKGSRYNNRSHQGQKKSTTWKELWILCKTKVKVGINIVQDCSPFVWVPGPGLLPFAPIPSRAAHHHHWPINAHLSSLSHFHTFPAYWCHLRPSRGATRCHCCFLTSHKILKLKPYPFEVSQSEWRLIYPSINAMAPNNGHLSSPPQMETLSNFQRWKNIFIYLNQRGRYLVFV